MVSRKKIAVVLVAAVALLVAGAGAPAFAQVWVGKGRLQGSVTDSQGKPVAGAKVTFHQGDNAQGPGPTPIATDANGKWTILGLAGGAWRIVIEKEGFVPSEGQVRVNESGPTAPINVTLREAPKAEAQPAQGTSGNEILGWIEHGNALLKEQKYADARAEYQRALEQLQPANKPAVLRGIAVTYYEEKSSEQAIQTLKTALEIKPDDPEILKLLVSWLVAAGREQEAKEYMAKLPQGTTVDPNSLLNLGIKAYNDKKLDDAAGYFDRVVTEHPDLPDGYYYRGLVALAQNKTAQAKADFEKLLQLAPNHPKAAEVKEYIKAL